MKPFVYHLSKNILNSFRGRNFLFHLLAIVLTAVIVYSGFDWEYFTAINGSSISRYLWPAIALGGLIPLISPLVFFGYAQLKKSARLANTGYALAQSAFLGLAISSFYKAFTGRVPPMYHMLAGVTDISHQFQFVMLASTLLLWPVHPGPECPREGDYDCRAGRARDQWVCDPTGPARRDGSV